MARQVRSEVTRRKILDAAIDVFDEVGYTVAGWGAIVERTGMTKGALYHHFDAKEPLASAIIEEGSQILLTTFRTGCGVASPALENMIHGTFAVVEMIRLHKMIRAAEQLAAALNGFNEAASSFYANWIAEMSTEARRAIDEGDLREDLDPKVVSESIVGAMFGARLLSNAMSHHGMNERLVPDLTGRLSQIWELLLPGLVSEASLNYFQQFLRRETMRHARAIASEDDVAVDPKTS